MNFPDANVLLYAVNTRHPSTWWLGTGSMVRSTEIERSRSPGQSCSPFRVSTNPAIFPTALSVGDSMDVVGGWTQCNPSAVIVNPARVTVPFLVTC